LLGDPGRLRQIIINLVGNAIKFTEQGEIVLRVHAQADTAGQDQVQFTVSDTGIGIPASKLSAIFEAFSQEDSSITRRYGGTGLGLSISARLVEALGGHMSVESELGQGSLFHFSMRLVRDTQAVDDLLEVTDLFSLRALVVDDNKVNRTVLVRVLQSLSAQAIEFESGVQALAWLREQQHGQACDLVLLDAHMPDLDGFEFAAQLRALGNCAQVPLIMLSSAGLKDDAQRSRNPGCDAYLSKPFTRHELVQVVCRVFGGGTTRPAELATRHAITDGKMSLDVLLVEDNVVNQKLAVALLNRWGHHVTVANNGQLALVALAQHQFDLVLMDMLMPVMGGLEATRLFRAMEQGSRTPIIAMTANAMPGDRADCLAAGMDDYISKPIETTELRRLLTQHMPGQVVGLPFFEMIKMNEPQPPASPRQAFDYDAALAASDQEVVEIIAEVFMAQWPIDMDKLNQALAAGDLQPVMHVAHALKGTLAMFGARPAVAIAGRVEIQSGKGRPEGLAELIAEMVTEVDQLLVAMRRAGP